MKGYMVNMAIYVMQKLQLAGEGIYTNPWILGPGHHSYCYTTNEYFFCIFNIYKTKHLLFRKYASNIKPNL